MSKSLVQPVPKLSNTKLGIKNTMAPEKQDLIRLQHDYLDQFTKKFLTEADIGSKILVYTPVKNLNPINAYYDPKHPNYPLNASSTRKLLTGGIKRRHKRNKTHKRKTRRA
jgi:hypothetical protein